MSPHQIVWKTLVAAGVVLVSAGGVWMGVGVFILLTGLDYMRAS